MDKKTNKKQENAQRSYQNATASSRAKVRPGLFSQEKNNSQEAQAQQITVSFDPSVMCLLTSLVSELNTFNYLTSLKLHHEIEKDQREVEKEEELTAFMAKDKQEKDEKFESIRGHLYI